VVVTCKIFDHYLVLAAVDLDKAADNMFAEKDEWVGVVNRNLLNKTITSIFQDYKPVSDTLVSLTGLFF